MADVVGITFAAIEFGLKILECYTKVQHGIKQYRQYERGVQKILQRISVRQTRFRAALVQLIAPYAGYDEASQMIQDSQHQTWQDNDFRIYLSRQLGNSADGFMDSLRCIESDLNDIEDVGKYCGFVVKRAVKNNGDRPPSEDPKTTVGSRIKYVFAQKEIDGLMKSLKEDTDDFCELVDTIQPVRDVGRFMSSTAATKMRIRRNNLVKSAARGLYAALGLACTKHTTHQVRLNLTASCQHASTVTFTVMFQHPDLGPFRPLTTFDCHQDQPHYKLLINSSVDSVQDCIDRTPYSVQGVIANIQGCQKRARDLSPSKSSTQKHKMIKWADNVSSDSANSLNASIVPELPNFCVNRNLCSYLRKTGVGVTCYDKPFGFMVCPSHNQEQRHMISILQAQALQVSELSKLFVSDSATASNLHQLDFANSAEFGQLHRVSMARMLARALLQYHETPWLDQSWCLDRIVVASNEALVKKQSENQNSVEYDSYLDVSLTSSGTEGIQQARVTDKARLIRNEDLFRLGVMMLEIASARSLKTSILPRDNDGHYAGNTEFHAARRVRNGISSKVGPEYAEVIRKCLECDFGEGSDLNDVPLQEAVYENVVQKLEDLEKDLRSLTI